MYHYVRDEQFTPPDYYYLDIDDFRQQLDYLENEYGWVSREHFLKTVQGELDEVPSGAVLTFDDGFRDHYEFVLPELLKRDLWGMFYIPAGPYRNDRILDVHRTHILLGQARGRELLKHVLELASEEKLPYQDVPSFRSAYRAFDDSKAIKEVKKILNMYSTDDHQTDLLDELFRMMNPPDIDPMEFYLRPDELREMADSGMILGGHTINHPVLSKLDRERQKSEIAGSFQVLEEILRKPLPHRTFCYPYGSVNSFNETTQSVLREQDCEWCFMVDPEDIQKSHIRNGILQLPRYDCNQFPYGDASGTLTK